MKKQFLDRRGFLSGSGALAAGLAMPALGAKPAFASGIENQRLRTVGLSVTVQERILNEFMSVSGVEAVTGKAEIFPTTQERLLHGTSEHDCWEVIGERLPPVVREHLIQPIPTGDLSNWGNIRSTFTTLNEGMESRAQIAGQIWADEERSQLWMVPTVYNFDSIGYRPDLVEAEAANSWAALFDPKFRGKTALNIDPLMSMGQTIIAMNSLGLLEVPNPGNPTRREIDEAIRFLLAKKKEGQFHSIWGDFGELVGLMVTGEVVLCDAWQPAVMAVKAEGIQCAYAVPKEGYRAWAIGISMMANSPNEAAVKSYADYWLSGPPAIKVSEQGYYSPTTNIQQVMPKEKYEFWYEGKPWVGAPERGISEGELRDGGSLKERASHVNFWHQWPDEHIHLVTRWQEFLDA